ncbi:DUF4838 domain-containing protein [Sphingobacterium thalpophilum]|uniref:DUF4838 domain-containing protein n=1 Tax=Sphingobacterium thalpophilum TaxID=259 RepID=UPI0031CE325B
MNYIKINRISAILGVLIIFCIYSIKAETQSLVVKQDSKIVILLPDNPSSQDEEAGRILKSNLFNVLNVNVIISKLSLGRAVKSDLSFFVGDFSKSNQIGFPSESIRSIRDDGFIIKIYDKNVYITGRTNTGGVVNGIYYFLEKFLGCRYFSPNEVTIPRKSNIILPENYNELVNPSFSYRALHFPDMYDPSFRSWNRVSLRDDIFGKINGYSTHTLTTLLPRELFKSHPEYFALYNGKRTPDHPCLSNPNVYEVVRKSLASSMNSQPSIKYWSVSQPDNDKYCQCGLCSKKYQAHGGSQQATILPFVNRLAGEFPNKIISTLAYSYSLKAPFGIKAADNVNVMVCNYNLKRDLKLSKRAGKAVFENYLIEWTKIADDIIVWDYVTQFTHFLAPYPNFCDFGDDLKVYARYKIKGVYGQGSGKNLSDFDELKSYLFSKKLWNINADENSIIKEFVDVYYGKAAPEVLTYINSLNSDFVQSDRNLRMMGTPLDGVNSYLSYNKLINYEKLLKNGLNKVASQKKMADRVTKILIGIQYAILQVDRENFARAKKGKSNNSIRYSKLTNLAEDKEVMTRLNEFIKNARSIGVRSLNNSSRSLDTYRNYFNQ